jgi:DNA-binding MarR family transcriptional regulator
MQNPLLIQVRKLSQLYAYTSIKMHETIARKAGFAGTDHKYLGFFLQKGKLTAGELSELSGLTTGAVTGLIDRFEKRGLVKREFDKSDRRKVFIVPDAPKIMAQMEPFYKEFQSESENLIDSFADTEQETLKTYFEKAIALMNTTNNKFSQEKPSAMKGKDINEPGVTDLLDKGPFYHGTRADLKIGDLLTAGYRSNYKPEITMNHIYFTALVNGAGLAAALAAGEGAERVYIVEPTGSFENDPNVTDKKFPGNPTRSYRSEAPLKIIGEVTDRERLTPEQVQKWREDIAKLDGEIIN